MSRFRFLPRASRLLLALMACGPLTVHAQVEAALVAADRSIQPGRPIAVALRMEHAPHWHSFWRNAGIGLPTRVQWSLPTGWSAGDIQWPTPTLIKDKERKVTGHGYEGLLYLPVTISPSADAAPGEEVTLRAAVRWLMCDDICIPGKQEISLTLPVAASSPQPNAEVRAGIDGMSMPHDAEGWHVAASRRADSVELHVAAPTAIGALHFYGADKLIQYDQPQAIVALADKTQLVLPVSEEGTPNAERLVGVLAYTDANGSYRGVSIDVPLPASDASVGIAGESGGRLSVGVLLLALLGGLILNLMPCVFPVLGIKVLGFIDQAGNDRRKVTAHGLAFTSGVLLSFWALAGALAVLRAGGEQLGWGFQLQSAPFVFALAVVMLIFALNLSGVFEVGLRATAVGSNLHLKQGITGSFFAGVLATVVATPCSAPFLAPALGAALALPTSASFAVFTAIAIGLSAPYLLLSIFPQATRVLPRPGRWMETFKQAIAFPLYATVGYLIWVLAGQASENGLLAALFGLTLVAMSAWIYGRYSAPGASVRRVRFGVAGGLLLLVAAVNVGWPRPVPAGEVGWERWSEQRIAQLRKEGRWIYVDFTARWCATCQTNKQLVFGSEAVRAYFREHNIAALRADWTNSDPLITAELAKWHRSAIPFNLIYRPGEPQPMALPEILTPSIVLDAFQSPSTIDRT